ncbi:MAG TPA: energy-coupling factor ABC transporter substrate-binding protein [Coleofasciculaceae cyanobacterium]|jgi:cobalt/nickel transport protein
MRKLSSNWLLIGGVLILALGPLLVLQGKEFGATDGHFITAIETDHPDYKPWFEPVIKDSGPEVQTFLFAAQAGIGAGVMGYILGLYKGRSERRERDEH